MKGMIMKTCIITGGNAGIGKAAAIQIAQKGYRVIICSRNAERGNKALEEIKESSGSSKIKLVQMDLASQSSIKAAAKSIRENHKTVDVLIHNAADFDITRKVPLTSPDGIESIWATNHIGPVYLTKLLMDQLKSAEQGRVITIASKGLIMHPGLKVNLQDPEFKTRSFSVPKAYYQSKLAQIMYTYWLSEQLKETPLTVNCIRVTSVKIDLSRYPDISKLAKFAYKLKSKSALSVEDMARTYTWLATSPEVARTTDKYFDEKNREVSSGKYSRDLPAADQLMELTMHSIK